MRTFNRILNFFWGDNSDYHARITIYLVFVVTGSLLVISLPWILKIIIDKFSNNNTDTIVLILVSYGILWGISQIMANVRELIAFRPIENSISRFGMQVFKSLTNRNFKYSNDHEIGRIMNAIEIAQDSIPDIFASILFVFMPMIIEICLAVGVIFYFYGAYYSSALFVLPIIYIAYSLLTSNMLIRYQRLANRSSANVSSFLADILLNIQGIYYQSAHRLVNAVCENKLKEREDTMTKQLERTSIVNIGQNIIASLGLILITSIVGFGVINNELTISDFVLFNGYLLQFIVPLNMIGILYRQLLEGITKLEDAVEIINTYEEEPDGRNLETTKVNYNISIKNVYFKYQETDNFAVNGINLDCNVHN